MEEIHFVHTTDWHLGFSQYNRVERFMDYYDAVKRTLRQIRKIDPQFVLHTGDIFHHSRPSPGAIRQAVKLFQQLDKANIPTYIIRGNHDGKSTRLLERGGSIISLLKDLKLATFIDDRVEKVPLKNAKILGIGYYPGNGVPKQIDRLLQREDNYLIGPEFKILALHAFVEGQLENFAHVTLSKLVNIGIDYIGVGHYHIPWQRPKYRIYAPGSTETTSSKDWNRDDMIDGISLYSSFYEVKVPYNGGWQQPEITKHDIPTRPKIMINHQSKGTSAEEVMEEILSILQQKREKIKKLEPSVAELEPVVAIEVKTDLSFEETSQIVLDDLSGYLHVSLDVTSEQEMKIEMNPTYITQSIEQLIMKQLGFAGKNASDYAGVILDIIEEYGSIPQSRDLADDQFDNLVELLDTLVEDRD